MFDELRRFVDRRIAELSVEVHGTAQLLDFMETNLSGQLSQIHAKINSAVSPPTQVNRNGEVELEAVVQATETAANQIMQAAEGIGDWVRGDRRDAASLARVAEKVNAIFEACTFQDITSQRIRSAIEHLQRVEIMLSEVMPTTSTEPDHVRESEVVIEELAQGEADSLFGSLRGG
jgi:chemotaxis protein CheZ